MEQAKLVHDIANLLGISGPFIHIVEDSLNKDYDHQLAEGVELATTAEACEEISEEAPSGNNNIQALVLEKMDTLLIPELEKAETVESCLNIVHNSPRSTDLTFNTLFKAFKLAKTFTEYMDIHESCRGDGGEFELVVLQNASKAAKTVEQCKEVYQANEGRNSLLMSSLIRKIASIMEESSKEQGNSGSDISITIAG